MLEWHNLNIILIILLYYQHEPGKTLILDEFVDITIKKKQIIGWTLIIDEQSKKLSLGTSEGFTKVLVSLALSK
jgi:hypothetical protein